MQRRKEKKKYLTGFLESPWPECGESPELLALNVVSRACPGTKSLSLPLYLFSAPQQRNYPGFEGEGPGGVGGRYPELFPRERWGIHGNDTLGLLSCGDGGFPIPPAIPIQQEAGP